MRVSLVAALLPGFAPACNGFVPAGRGVVPPPSQHPMMMNMNAQGGGGNRTPLRSKIEHALAVAVATSAVVLSTASAPAALAEELPPGAS